MASAPLTSWQIDGETMEAVETATDFIFFGGKTLNIISIHSDFLYN